ncbi:hypothetical protein [Hydrogenimonas sp.]
MKSVKAHLALILPLFAILFGAEYLIVFDRIVDNYETKLSAEYSLIVVADKALKPVDISRVDRLIDRVEPVDIDSILHRIRKETSEKNMKKIKSIMPSFYSVKLRHYPDKYALKRLKEELLAIKGVKSVYLFEKMHDPLYEMLAFMKSNFLIFSLLMFVVGVLLILKQMYVWQLEHRERMQIMALFGAPVWLRSGVLFRLAIIDAFIALLLIVSGMFYLMKRSDLVAFLRDIDIDPQTLFHFNDIGLLAAIGFGISIFGTLVVVIRFKEEL